jgi:mannitol-1-phosphate/altronate dehydrogenase
MIRRITPRAEIRDRFGIDDQWPVVCEPFTQWVLQDTFAADRPAYERAGVQVVGGRLTRAARRQREDPLAFIADREVFGDVADDQRFVAAYASALASLHLRGARATLESLA